MPELPEVERFRTLLAPLVSKTQCIEIALVGDNPPRVWLSAEQVEDLTKKQVFCEEVLRKGKQLCMVLTSKSDDKTQRHYLFLHMGMTGSIKSPGIRTELGHEGPMKNDDDDSDDEQQTFPPNYAHLTLQTGEYQAAFCDPRKFGKCELLKDLSSFDSLAPDALLGHKDAKINKHVISKLTNQAIGIKALLLDQKRAVSGVGNWVADEVLYQVCLHPDQSYLTRTEATGLLHKLEEILACAVECLEEGRPYPSNWLFPYRWTKKKAGKDSKGQELTFLKSGGRTSAIVLPLQPLEERQKFDDEDEAAETPTSSGESKHQTAIIQEDSEANSNSGGSPSKKRARNQQQSQQPRRRSPRKS